MSANKHDPLDIWFNDGGKLEIKPENAPKEPDNKPLIICAAPWHYSCDAKYKHKGLKKCKRAIGTCSLQLVLNGNIPQGHAVNGYRGDRL